MNILVTGGTGFVGVKLVEALAERHHDVVVLTRDPRRAKRLLPPQVKPLASLKESPSSLDGVVNLMGENIAQRRWSKKQKEKIADSRILGTRQLIAHLQENLEYDLKFFLSASAIGFYEVPHDHDRELDEQSPPGKGFLPQLCQGWEGELHSLSRCQRKVVVRIGVILGEGGGALGKIFPIFRWGLGGALGKGEQWMSWIHRDDLISLFIHLIENSHHEGVVNGVAPHPVRNKEFTKELGRVLKRPTPFAVPSIVLKLAMGEVSSLLLDSQRVIPGVLLKSSKFSFKYPTIRQALEHLCRTCVVSE